MTSPNIAIISGLTNNKSHEKNGIKRLKQIYLRHPHKDCKNMYLIDTETRAFYEIVENSSDYRSVIIDDFIKENGTFSIITNVDILFILLPFMVNKKDFRTLFDILSDNSTGNLSPNDIDAIESAVSSHIISMISDIKYVDEQMYIKYNHEKTINWLMVKIEKVSNALRENNIGVTSTGSKISGFTTGKEDPNQENDAFRRMSFDIISEYLPEALLKDLQKTLKIRVTEECSLNQQNQNKRKINDDHEKIVKDPERTPIASISKVPKLSRSQRELLKVDKSGMKSISSFFKPKPK